MKTQAPQFQAEQVRSLIRGITREFGVLRNFCGDSKVTPAEAHILLEINIKGFLTLKELSQIMSLDKSTLSRTVKTLLSKGYLKISKTNQDKRYKHFHLSQSGKEQVEIINCKYNNLVSNTLSLMANSDVEGFVTYLTKFYKSLKTSQSRSKIVIRELKKNDENYIRQIIKSSVKELGETEDELLTMCPEINYLYEFYNNSKSKYFIALDGDLVIGGSGIAPLKGALKDICELQKMYIMPGYRGIGLGKTLLEKCITAAKNLKYKTIYLDTREDMTQAINLYKSFGFKEIKQSLGSTGHFLCGKYFTYNL